MSASDVDAEIKRRKQEWRAQRTPEMLLSDAAEALRAIAHGQMTSGMMRKLAQDVLKKIAAASTAVSGKP